MRIRGLSGALILLAVTSVVATPALGQTMVNVYTVNFVCGYQASADGTEGYEPLVKVANYATKIDVNNFGNATVTVAGQVYNTTGSPWPNNVGGSQLAVNSMPMRTSTVIDCNTIAQTIGPLVPGKPFFSGMVTIRSGDPLIVWATKTTQVCAGTAAWVQEPLPGPIYPYQPIFLGDDLSAGLSFTLYPGPGGGTTNRVDWSTFGCPSAIVDTTGQVTFYHGPAGAIPPGSRSPAGLVPVGPIFGQPTPEQPSGDLNSGSLSISHSMDFERVTAELLELPPGVPPPGCI